MTTEVIDDVDISLTTKEEIAFFRMAQLKVRLELEIHGLKCHGPSAYKLIKASYGLRGSRERVLSQFEAMIERQLKERQA
jgi:hypothetical protein